MAEHSVYAVASGKGGVGKTTTTVNLGAALAEQGHSVVLVDVDLGMANLAGSLGLDPDGRTLHGVLGGDATLEDAVYEVAPGLAVVPSGTDLDAFADVDTSALSEAVSALSGAFDYVLLDLGAGLSHDSVLPLALADAVLLVSTPRTMALQDTSKTREVTERLGGAIAGTVLTRAGSPADLDLEEAADLVGIPVLAVVPEDPAVQLAADAGHPVTDHAPDTPAAVAYRGLAEIVIEESLANAPVVPEPPTGEDASGDEAPTAEPSATDEASAAANDGSVAADPEPAAGPADTGADAGNTEPEPEPGDAEAQAEPGDVGTAAEPSEGTPAPDDTEPEPADGEADDAAATEPEPADSAPRADAADGMDGSGDADEPGDVDDTADAEEPPSADDIATAIEEAAAAGSDGGVLTVDETPGSADDADGPANGNAPGEDTPTDEGTDGADDPDPDEDDDEPFLGTDTSDDGPTLSGGSGDDGGAAFGSGDGPATGEDGDGEEDEDEDEDDEGDGGGLLGRLFGG